MNPRKVFYALIFAILTLSPLTLINQDTIIRDKEDLMMSYFLNDAHSEVHLLNDLTFKYLSSGCSGYQEGNGTYSIQDNIITLNFAPMPKEISSLFTVDSFPSVHTDSSSITINYSHFTDSIDEATYIFNYIYDKDKVFINKHNLRFEKDSTYTFTYPSTSKYHDLNVEGINSIRKNFILEDNISYDIYINAEFLKNNKIYNTKYKYRFTDKPSYSWNCALLITPNNDSMIIDFLVKSSD